MGRKELKTLEFAGPQYPGRQEAGQVFAELERQAEHYRDFSVSTRSMELKLHEEHGIVLHFAPDQAVRDVGIGVDMPMSKRAWVQLAQWMGVPTNSLFYKRLRWGFTTISKRNNRAGSDRFWQTWINMVNDHFKIVNSQKLIRTLKRADGEWYVRAFLGSTYLVIPNNQLFLAVADKLKEAEVEFWDARLSEDSFYLYAVAPGVSAQIRTDRPWDKNYKRFIGDDGDTANAALMLRNSETGQGSCEVCPAIVTGMSGAYFVKQNALSMRHVGKKHEMDSMLTDETIKKRNSVVYDEVRDYCAAVFDMDKFQAFVDQVCDATQDEIDDPVKAVEAVAGIYDLSETRKDEITKWIFKSADRSRYGLACAVTKEAHDNPNIGADEAAKLEQVAGALIEEQTAVKLAKQYKKKAEDDAYAQAVKTARSTPQMATIEDAEIVA